MRAKGGETFQVFSAGSRPANEIHPLAISAMDGHGIDIRSQRPKAFGDLPKRTNQFDYVISVCDMGLEGCPYIPGRRRSCHWELLDPVPLAEALGDAAKARRLFRTTSDIIEEIVDEIIEGHTAAISSGSDVTTVWTNKHFAAMLRDFRHLSELHDPVKAGANMFAILDEARRRSKDPDRYRRIFIAHGHDKGTREEIKTFLLKQTAAIPIILQEIAPVGLTIIEKLEAHSDVVAAIIIVTEDDLATPIIDKGKLKPRARENVIFEMGYFVARLGRNNVCVVSKGNVKLPSDLAGLDFIKFDRERTWKSKVSAFLCRTPFSLSS